MNVSSEQRFKRDQRCPVCGGTDGDPRHQGVRCHGFLSHDGRTAFCSREECAGTIELNAEIDAYPHRLDVPCPCGQIHTRPSWWQVRITKYDIKDVDGKVVAVHVREDMPSGHKNIWWEGPDGKMGLNGRAVTSVPLYGIDELATADPDEPVVVTEGEKSRDALKANGFLAVATVTGARTTHVLDAFKPLLGRRVFLWPDNDDDGRSHMLRNRSRLREIGHTDILELNWPDAPAKGDAADFFTLGGTREKLADMIAAAEAVEKTDGDYLERLDTFLAEEDPPRDMIFQDLLPRGVIMMLHGQARARKGLCAFEIAVSANTGTAPVRPRSFRAARPSYCALHSGGRRSRAHQGSSASPDPGAMRRCGAGHAACVRPARDQPGRSGVGRANHRGHEEPGRSTPYPRRSPPTLKQDRRGFREGPRADRNPP